MKIQEEPGKHINTQEYAGIKRKAEDFTGTHEEQEDSGQQPNTPEDT